MPYKIKHRGSGFKVTTPNHPQGFSKKPQTHAKAVAQLRAIKANTNEELVQEFNAPLFCPNCGKTVFMYNKAYGLKSVGDLCPICRKDYLIDFDPVKREHELPPRRPTDWVSPAHKKAESLAERIVNALLNENDEDGEPYGETCPACGGDAYELGRLGHTTHWRCRQCGYDFPEDTTPPPKAIYFSGAGYSGAGMHAVGGSGGLDTGGSAVG